MAAGLGVANAFDTDMDPAVLAGAAGAVLLLSLALASARSAPLPFALLILVAIYSVPEGDRVIAAPLYAAALLLTAEAAYWSFDERIRVRIEPGAGRPRLLAVLAVSAAAIPASTVVLAVAKADVARSPVLTAAGAAAIVACVALLTGLARARA